VVVSVRERVVKIVFIFKFDALLSMYTAVCISPPPMRVLWYHVIFARIVSELLKFDNYVGPIDSCTCTLERVPSHSKSARFTMYQFTVAILRCRMMYGLGLELELGFDRG